MATPQFWAWVSLFAAGAALPATAQPWKDKRIAEWSVEDARLVLTDSPWAKTVTPTGDGTSSLDPQRVGMGPGGIGIGGLSVGVPGMGRRGGRGGRGANDGGSRDAGPMPTLTLRWTSALPVSAAQLLAKELDAPYVDENHYAIAVYGVPGNLLPGDPNKLGPELAKHAVLKREGKKDMKPSSVQVLIHEQGPVILYLFPRSNEIARKDSEVDFDVEIGRLKFTQAFVPGEMVYQDKLEL